MVFEHAHEYPSQWAAMRSVAEKLGVRVESLRRWIRQAERDAGTRAGLTTNERDEVKRLQRDNFVSADPTALRSFRASDRLSAYAEVYTELDNDFPDARLAAIRVATLAAAITTPEGVPVARLQSQRVTAAPAGKMLREGFRTDFDLLRLTPGRYVLTIEAASGRDRKRTATKQIPIDTVE